MIYFKRNKLEEKKVWHKWFAWYPVTVAITPDGDKKKIWWQFVQRCYYPCYHYKWAGNYIITYKHKYKELLG